LLAAGIEVRDDLAEVAPLDRPGQRIAERASRMPTAICRAISARASVSLRPGASMPVWLPETTAC
jgi:hypothetical protein